MKHNNQAGEMARVNGSDEIASEAGSALLESLVGYAMRRTTAVFMADFMAEMEDLGMRPALFAMLAMTGENPGINQTALGRSLGIQRANLVPLIGELLARGLVDRRPAPHDRRAFALHLTDEGQAMLREVVRRVRPHEERMLSPLSENERRTLLDLLGRIRAR
ncbi:MarR family winged helix-turn-helix transcriptional regulator [Sphingosinicella sp. CPCC 101087]|uniref:MarR family winged helix-turn-helix transcriptional regulator n=1 Tax=Sphingosinicella sp. CPCC 101087 TaxID=2497754 RepID=UPI0013ED8E72|nr:MarR family transcriptional regulator [Sphingosinicella sp. CPCC 101087]